MMVYIFTVSLTLLNARENVASDYKYGVDISALSRIGQWRLVVIGS